MPVAQSLKLYNFTVSEFGPTQYREKDWWGQMNARQLVLLDVFRQLWGRPVTISGSDMALGRHDGADDTGDHNVDFHGSVCASDVFAEIEDRVDAEDAVELALSIGFTAVGLYPHWNGGIGLHLGARPERTPQNPATWGAVDRDGEQVYVSLEYAMNRIERG